MGRFDPNPDFPRNVVTDSPELDALMTEKGLELLEKVEELSRVFYRTGDWQDNLTGRLGRAQGYPYYRVEDMSQDAVYIEFGTSKTPAHRALGRAVGALTATKHGTTDAKAAAKAKRSAAAKARWAALSEGEKAARVAKLQAGAAASRAKKKAAK